MIENKFSKNAEPAYVYAVLFNDGVVKVGRTHNPKLRIKSLRDNLNLHGIPVKVVDSSVSVHVIDGRKAEDYLISLCLSLGHQYKGKEWFYNLNFNELKAAVLGIKEATKKELGKYYQYRRYISESISQGVNTMRGNMSENIREDVLEVLSDIGGPQPYLRYVRGNMGNPVVHFEKINGVFTVSPCGVTKYKNLEEMAAWFNESKEHIANDIGCSVDDLECPSFSVISVKTEDDINKWIKGVR